MAVSLSGRYRGLRPGRELELRVDVDGPRPLMRVSGDLFEVGQAGQRVLGSFEFTDLAGAVTPSRLLVVRTVSFDGTDCSVSISIARAVEPAGPAAATVAVAPASGEPATTYDCPFVSPHFRTVVVEQDRLVGTEFFDSYDTGQLMGPERPPRVLSVAAAFAEAGIELKIEEQHEVVALSVPDAGADLAWSDSELHDAMERHFNLWTEAPRWQVWLFVATRHEKGHRGSMFDGDGNFQRQGAAVFFDTIRGDTPEDRRAQLRTYVHELGHAFNIVHSWKKDEAHPPQPLGPMGGFGELSWMNSPERYERDPPPGGDEAYWENFGFEFTDGELAHLRHGAYPHVAMGADRFETGAADAGALFDRVASDELSLTLELRPKQTFAYGEPVRIELKLATVGGTTVLTHGFLQPSDDFVRIAIRQPSGRTLTYRPLMPRCVDATDPITLDAATPATYDSAFIGYGCDGQYFAEPGDYELRGEYVDRDGSRVVSPVARLHVSPPSSVVDRAVGELLLGRKQGKLVYLDGSDAESLRAGNEAFDQLLAEHAGHPLTVHARRAKGVNAGRDFKWLDADRRLWTRAASADESIALLEQVVAASRPSRAKRLPSAGIDDISLGFVAEKLAAAHARKGDIDSANGVLDDFVTIIEGRGVRPDVLDTVRLQVDQAKFTISNRTPQQ